MNKKVIFNATWIIGCKIVQSVISFLIGIFTARYLGPSNYGLVSYAAALSAFALPIMRLGLSDTIVREIIVRPQKEGEVLGTSVVLCILSSMASIIGLVTFAYVANPHEKETILVCMLYSFTLFFQAGEIIQYWFQAKLMSKYSSMVALVAYCVVSLYKIYILVTGKTVIWFALSHVIESFVISGLLFFTYKRKSNQPLSFSLPLGREMLMRSKHYIYSGLMVVIFQQTDRIMLKTMTSDVETGYYSAAITCIGITGFLYSAIIDSTRPYILEGKDISTKVFEKRLKSLFSIIIVVSLLQSVIMGAMANIIIKITFGEEFLYAAEVLQIAVWFITFGYLGAVRNIWILAEEKQKHLPIINVLGAVLNIIVNALLIPIMGAKGAAIASIITQFFSNVVLCFVIREIRPVGKLIAQSLNSKQLIYEIKSAVYQNKNSKKSRGDMSREK